MKNLRIVTRVERTPLTEVAVVTDPSRRCKCTITLGDRTYACVRGGRDRVHDGAHDANVRHTDGHLVRW